MNLLTLMGVPDDPVPVKQSPAEKRRAKMKRAFERSDAMWRESYERFILDYADRHPSFIAENCRLEYESRTDLPQLHGADKRASGAIFIRLVREGKLKRIGTERSALRCSPMPLYTKGVSDGNAANGNA